MKNNYYTFERYLINVGIRSSEFTYEDEVIFKNIPYFKKCYKEGLSEYKALLFLKEHINKHNVNKEFKILKDFSDWRLNKPYSSYTTMTYDIIEFLKDYNHDGK